MQPLAPATDRTAPEVRIGHVHLKVADLDRAIGFYSGVLGLDVTQRYGSRAAFLSAGGYHHHLGLNVWESAGARRRRPATQVSTTQPSCTPTGRRSGAPCAA